MASKIIPFYDAIVSTLVNAFAAVPVVATITREYDIEYDLGTFTGLKVNVFPDQDLIAEEATRKEDYYDVSFSIVMAERYTLATAIPKAWLDTRVGYAENLIAEVLYPPTSRPLILSGAYGEFWSLYCNRIVICDMPMLRVHKVFWSELEGSFRKLR